MTEQTKRRPAPKVPAEVRAQFSGAYGTVSLEGMDVSIQVKDVRSRYGHLDFLVEPVKGTGSKWIQSDRVSL